MKPGKPYNPDAAAKAMRSKVTNEGGGQFWSRLTREAEDVLNEGYDIAERTRDPYALSFGYDCLVKAHWVKTKGVYAFDETLASALEDSAIDGLRLGTFLRLPEWAVFLEFSRRVDVDGEERLLAGAYVCLIRGEALNYLLVVSVFVDNGEAMNRSALYVIGEESETIGERHAHRGTLAIDANGALKDVGMPDYFRWPLIRAAYLCTAEPDLRDPREPRAMPQRKRNNGPVRQWEVGYRFGAAFRKQLAEAEQRAGTGHGGERNRPRVHVRRAHWHSFWTGPKDGERKRIVKWLPPVIVNAEGDDLPVTIWRQK